MWMEVPPVERNGVISMYEVRYVPLETCSGTLMASIISITNTSMTSTTLTDLKEYVEYNVSIRSYTSVGPGPYSNSVVERTEEDAPDVKLNATAIALSETEIAVCWVELPDICQNGNITVYEIRYEPLDTFGVLVTRFENVTAPTTIETLTDLEESVGYNISVRAYTSVGPGPYSDPVTAMTFEDSPRTAPRNVTTMVLSSTEILVTWERVLPIDENGEILLYEVEFVPLETFDMDMSTNTTNTTSLNITLTDLEEDVDYNISVRAFTSAGPGPYSDAVTNRTLEDRPTAAPQNVTTMAESSTEIVVTWEEVPAIDENGDITMYEVEYMPLETFNGQIATDSVTVDPTLLNTTLTGLEEYVDYNISVRAFTSVGPGPYSDGMVERTLEDAPAAAPQNVMATAVSSTEIRVSWEPVAPIDQNGVITMYGVRFEPLETFNGVLVTETVNTTGPVLRMNLTGLEEDVEYNISVRAFTSVGPGPYSVGTVERTDQDVPDAPPQNVMTVLSSTEIQVSWEEVPAINQSGSITFFEVRYNPLETFNGSLSTNTTITTMLGITLNSLEENVDYNISVRAYSVIGPGPYSEGVVKRTDEDRPTAAPQNVMTMAESSTEIVVTWEEVPAIDENGDITTYEVEYMPLETFNGQIATDSVTVASTPLSTTLTGLEEYVDYNISVRAFTSVGPGPYSDGMIERTLEDAPAAAPQNVMATAVSSTEIRVSWEPVAPIDQNGVITMYGVRFEPLETFNGVLVTETVNTTGPVLRMNLTGLEEDVEYNIRVRGFTSVAPGPYSDGMIEETGASPPTGVTAVQDGPTSITVSWVPSSDATGYIVSYTGGSSNGSETVSGGDTNSYTLTGLTNGQTYTISIVATSEYLFSDAATFEITLIPAPGQVLVSVSSITATSISLSWNVSSGRVASWEVVWRPTDRGTESTSGPLSGTTYTINQLDPSTIYILTVRATNVAGTTDSTPILFRTVTEVFQPDSSSTETDTSTIIGGVVAVVITTSLTVVVIVVLLLRSRSGNYSAKTSATVVATNQSVELSNFSEAIYADPDELQTTSNEAYNVVKGTGRTAEGEYEVLQDLPSPTSSSGPTTTDADGDYEPV
ncbi:Phosphatidylinositol phosphatase PTPRQ [Geodia barretti]|uniref:Phosphatidylinositol phosphatase PTPRQ n=1 Tax=Geodia barretti TaxID=519541 RepID=A0AA35SYL1_GEOBA|nr:Phosphatidylinositol phosphatase PTPRQ [Geodia barretti]